MLLKYTRYPRVFELPNDFIIGTQMPKEVIILGRVYTNNAYSKLFKKLNTRDIFDLLELFFKLFFDEAIL